MATITDEIKAPFMIYEDSISDSDMSFFNADVPMPSIERVETVVIPPSPSSGMYSTSSNRRVSDQTAFSSISDIPSELCLNAKESSPFTPAKDRSAFRNPSSVRPLQMASPSIFAYDSTKRQDRLTSSPRRSRPASSRSMREDRLEANSETPVSRRPVSRGKENYPLILLHVSIMPVCPPFPASVMEHVLPEHVLRNWRLLEEKLSDAVLMQRGLLIPHPRDEYELLEERLLEALGLRSPRILKCGHFHSVDNNDGEDTIVLDHDHGLHHRTHSRTDSAISTSGIDRLCADPCNAAHGDASEGPLCDECHMPVKHDDTGAGSGTQRWDIRIYAANGLMRAGAWSAAWSEMERVDVEIAPWVSDEQRRAMERSMVEEDEEKRLQLLEAEEQRKREIVEAQGTARAEVLEKARLEAEEAARIAEQALEEERAARVAALTKASEEAEEAARQAEEALEKAIAEKAEALVRAKLEAEEVARQAAEEFEKVKAEKEEALTKVMEKAEEAAQQAAEALAKAREEAEEAARSAEAEKQELARQAEEEKDVLIRMAAEEKEEMIRQAQEAAKRAEDEKLRLIGSAAVAAEAARKRAQEELEAERKRHKKEAAAARKLAAQKLEAAKTSLPALLLKCLFVLLKDSSNILVILLSAVVVFLSTRPGVWTPQADIAAFHAPPSVNSSAAFDAIGMLQPTAATAFTVLPSVTIIAAESITQSSIPPTNSSEESETAPEHPAALDASAMDLDDLDAETPRPEGGPVQYFDAADADADADDDDAHSVIAESVVADDLLPSHEELQLEELEELEHAADHTSELLFEDVVREAGDELPDADADAGAAAAAQAALLEDDASISDHEAAAIVDASEQLAADIPSDVEDDNVSANPDLSEVPDVQGFMQSMIAPTSPAVIPEEAAEEAAEEEEL